MATGVHDQRMRAVSMAAKLCAASLGTRCAILDNAFNRIGTFEPEENRAGSLCQQVQAVPDGAARCAAAHKSGAKRAAQFGGTYFYACHAGLVEAIASVHGNGIPPLHILIGPVLQAPADAFLTKKIANAVSAFHIDGETARQAIGLIPVVEPERLKQAMNLLNEIMSASPADAGIPSRDDVPKDEQPEIIAASPACARVPHHNNKGEDTSMKARSILAKSRLGNRGEMQQEITEAVLRKAQWHPNEDVQRFAALETIAALWRTALDQNGTSSGTELSTLGLRQLFKSNTVHGVLNWAAAAAGRVARSSGAVPPQARAALKQVRDYTRPRLDQKLSCAGVARALKTDSRQLERVLRRHLGMSFREYLTMERLTAARKLLRESDMTASNIAARVGFNDQSNFTKIFTKCEGITPIHYRRDNSRTARLLESE